MIIISDFFHDKATLVIYKKLLSSVLKMQCGVTTKNIIDELIIHDTCKKMVLKAFWKIMNFPSVLKCIHGVRKQN